MRIRGLLLILAIAACATAPAPAPFTEPLPPERGFPVRMTPPPGMHFEEGWKVFGVEEPWTPTRDALSPRLTAERITRRGKPLLRIGTPPPSATPRDLPPDAIRDVDALVIWHPRFQFTGCTDGDHTYAPPLPRLYAIPATQRAVVVQYADVPMSCWRDARQPTAASWKPAAPPTTGERALVRLRVLRSAADVPVGLPDVLRDFDFETESLVQVGDQPIDRLDPVRPPPGATSELALRLVSVPIDTVSCYLVAAREHVDYFDETSRHQLYRVPASTRTLVVLGTASQRVENTCPTGGIPASVYARDGEHAWVGLYLAEYVPIDRAIDATTPLPARDGVHVLRVELDAWDYHGEGSEVDTGPLHQLYRVRLADLPVVLDPVVVPR